MTPEDKVKLERLIDEATPGPWFAANAAVHSKPISDEYMRLEVQIPDDAPDDDPRWEALPEARLAFVPVAGGDTPTQQGERDANFIAAARTAVPELLAEVDGLEAQRSALIRKTIRDQEQRDTLDRLVRNLNIYLPTYQLIDHLTDDERTELERVLGEKEK